jgi:hypothetical protein
MKTIHQDSPMKTVKTTTPTAGGRVRRRWRPRSLLALARAATASSTATLLPRLSVAALVAAVGVADVARAAQTGELGGVVLDENGEALAGVRVILQSPQMIGGAREQTTDASGGFRFPNLDPGSYTVTLSSPTYTGFEEKDIYVGIDDHVEREYLLEKAKDAAAGEKVIRVTATRPMVDATRVSQGTSISAELTDRTATSRSYQGVALLTPGVVGGSTAAGNPSVHGGTPFSNVYLLDGLNITDPVTQTFSTNFNFDAIGELEVITGGLDAEYGNTTGGLLNIVTKSGGDEFTLDGSVYYAPKELQLLDPGEVNDSNEIIANLSVGGPIIKKKLWFFLSGQYLDSVSTTPVSDSPFGADFVVPPRRFNAFYGLGKLKWQVTPWQKLTLLIQGDPTWITNEKQSGFVTNDAQRQRYQGGAKIVTTSETMLSDNLFWKNQIGYASDQLFIYPMSCSGDFTDCALNSEPGHTNQATGTSTVNDTLLTDDRRYRLIAGSAMSYFLDGFLGDHEFKLGLEGTLTFNSTNDWVPGGETYLDNGIDQTGSTVDGKGDPFQRTIYPEALQKTVSANLISAYLQDTWHPMKGVTLRPGLRFDSSRGYNDAAEGGNEIFGFNTLSPRLGAAWDPFGDGKTVVRGGYFFYNETGLLLVPSFVGRGLSSKTYGFNPETGKYDVFIREEGGQSAVAFKNGMVAPNMHEVVFGAQREVAENTSFGVDFTYRRRQNMFEDDESNVIWNERGDNAVGFRNGEPRFIYSVGTPDESMGQYVGVDFILDKRLANDWQAYVTYTLSRLEGTNENLVTYAFDNPTQRPYEYGFLADDVRHKLRATLSYDLPYGLQVGGTATYFSGRPLTKFFLNSFYGDYYDKRAPSGYDPKDVANPDDDVEFRTPDIFFIDARVAWRLKELTTQDIWLIADVFNLLNTRPPNDFELRDLPAGDGPQFGDVLGRAGPMNAQVAVRYMF